MSAELTFPMEQEVMPKRQLASVRTLPSRFSLGCLLLADFGPSEAMSGFPKAVILCVCNKTSVFDCDLNR